MIAPLLVKYGARVGKDVRFNAPMTVHNSAFQTGQYYRNLTVGAHCYIGREFFLDLQDRVVIGDNVTISHQVSIYTHTDAGNSPLAGKAIPTSQAPVTIGKGAYIGSRVTILEGVSIGENAVIGAGSLVHKSVNADDRVAGVPARSIVRSGRTS